MKHRPEEPDGPSAIACDPNAIPPEQHDRWSTVLREVHAAIEEVREVPDGYRLRLPASTEMLRQLAEYVSYERLCCGFLRFQVEVEPARGPVWLQLTGDEGGKEYLRIAIAARDQAPS
jgi:hypothetical protein